MFEVDNPIYRRALRKLSQRDQELVEEFGVGNPPWRPGDTFFTSSSFFDYGPPNPIERRAWDGARKRFWDHVEQDGADELARDVANTRPRELSISRKAHTAKTPLDSGLILQRRKARDPIKTDYAVNRIKQLVRDGMLTYDEVKGRVPGGRSQVKICEIAGVKRGTGEKAIKLVAADKEFAKEVARNPHPDKS